MSSAECQNIDGEVQEGWKWPVFVTSQHEKHSPWLKSWVTSVTTRQHLQHCWCHVWSQMCHRTWGKYMSIRRARRDLQRIFAIWILGRQSVFRQPMDTTGWLLWTGQVQGHDHVVAEEGKEYVRNQRHLLPLNEPKPVYRPPQPPIEDAYMPEPTPELEVKKAPPWSHKSSRQALKPGVPVPSTPDKPDPVVRSSGWAQKPNPKYNRYWLETRSIFRKRPYKWEVWPFLVKT